MAPRHLLRREYLQSGPRHSPRYQRPRSAWKGPRCVQPSRSYVTSPAGSTSSNNPSPQRRRSGSLEEQMSGFTRSARQSTGSRSNRARSNPPRKHSTPLLRKQYLPSRKAGAREESLDGVPNQKMPKVQQVHAQGEFSRLRDENNQSTPAKLLTQ